MVLRPTNGPIDSSAAMALSQDHTTPSQQRGLQSDMAALHLDPPQRPPPPPRKDSNHEDSDSDWDASEREDEPEPRAAGQPPLSKAPQTAPEPRFAPHPPSQPLPLNVNFTGNTRPEDELVRSPWAETDGFQSTTSSRPDNNPFRRPTDYTPTEKANKHASVWHALDDGNAVSNSDRRPAFEQPQTGLGTSTEWADEPPSHSHKQTPSSESHLIDLDPSDPSNPWDDGSSGISKGKEKAVPSNVAPSNPWEDPSRKPVPTYSQVIRDAPTAEARTGINQLQSLASSAPATKAGSSTAQVPQADVERQGNAIYQVKRVRWYDQRSSSNPRESPILVQNANGPCPLLALVNALSLSTPPDLQTELIRTLQNREQISLGLLIDAVFEELMSGRRSDVAQDLPDVSELYSFLVTLHTGMNVNPSFVQNPHAELAGIGAFEPTREMRLYSTFEVPLIHGWVPSVTEPASAAFTRIAPTYEEAQNVLFREEELERKLGSADVTQDEQNVLMDIASIKAYFRTWPTQLTDHGLETFVQRLIPGSVSILFRNDHFSTLYKEPKSNQLMTLVTDAGYAGHDEIVWESLADISGTNAEMFSGDFRCVTHNGGGAARDGGEWNAVPEKSRRKPVPTAGSREPDGGAQVESSAPSHGRSMSEQEDHDLALALQLQEEEDQRHRSDQAARRREDELSQQYISGDAPAQRPQIPPRRSNRPATHREEQDPELPSYEQAAATRPYRPPQGHPSSEFSAQQQATSNAQSNATQRRRGRSSAGMPAVDARRHQTEYDSYSDRREGCTMM